MPFFQRSLPASPASFWRRGLRFLARIALLLALVLALLCALLKWHVAQPTFSGHGRSTTQLDPERLRAHVKTLSVDFFPRHGFHMANQRQCADYIAEHFTLAGARVERQRYLVEGREYQNIIGRFGPAAASNSGTASTGTVKKLIIGAHYDSHADTPGADDNASGVAGLLELAYLLKSAPLTHEVELVAYTLEEPPFFMGEHMGSVVHAKQVAAEKDRLLGVIVLEMIGYFSDQWGSQSYPMPLLHLIYPQRGNFVAVVGDDAQRPWTRQVKQWMQDATPLPVYSINAPSNLPGINFSDHASYWPHHIPAVMITDTAFYRNEAYHHAGDTYDRLDYNKMRDVVLAVHHAVLGLGK